MRFSVLSGDEIRQSAEAQVWSKRMYGPDMKPVPNGLLDARMGAANKQGDCEGIPTIERAVVNPVYRYGRGVKTFDRYNLLVEGKNLLRVLGTPGVDANKTKSNHIMEVNQTLGIEAARRSIIDEIQYTFESNNMKIELRHMMLLADLMTYKGEILGITRNGIVKMKSSVLMLASFEKTTEHLFNASYAGREDQIEGVSERIIIWAYTCNLALVFSKSGKAFA